MVILAAINPWAAGQAARVAKATGWRASEVYMMIRDITDPRRQVQAEALLDMFVEMYRPGLSFEECRAAILRAMDHE